MSPSRRRQVSLRSAPLASARDRLQAVVRARSRIDVARAPIAPASLDGYRGLWSREMGMAIEGPAPGFLGFVRWLFEPIRPPRPPSPPTAAEAREILAAMAELEVRRRSTLTMRPSLSSSE